jgi:hypothetical protein
VLRHSFVHEWTRSNTNQNTGSDFWMAVDLTG